MPENKNIILCLPGQWKDRPGILSAIALANLHEYVFAGNILLHLPTGDGFELVIESADERLAEAFSIASQGRLSEDDLDAIGNHTFVIYLLRKGGSTEDAEKMINAGNAILKAGALGIKVETAGRAFTPEQWTEISHTEGIEKFYQAYVAMALAENNEIYTCGMHNMGLRDILFNPGADMKTGIELVSLFICYLLYDKPDIEPGETFSRDADAPIYTILEEGCTRYAEDDPFFNPFGMYRLQPA